MKRFLLWLGRIERKFLSWIDDYSMTVVAILMAVFLIGIIGMVAVGLSIRQNELEVIDESVEELDVPLDRSARWHLEEDGSWTCYGPDGKKSQDSVVCACAKTPE